MQAPSINQHFQLCEEAWKIYKEKYSRVNLSPTVHRLIVHSTQLLFNIANPGIYTEEAQESCNKIVRYLRDKNARKTSRLDNIQDIYTNWMARSDPVILNENS